MKLSKVLNASCVIFSVCFLASCATPKKAEQAKQQAYIEQVKKLEKEVSNLREQNSILKKSPNKNTYQSSNGAASEFSGEHALYTTALDSYWKKDLIKLEKSSSLLIKGFPDSVHGDNALYLTASLQLEQGKVGEALQTVNRLLRLYPVSNKALSAEILKAEIFETLNLKDQARDVYQRISKTYVGSREAQIASSRLKNFVARQNKGTKTK